MAPGANGTTPSTSNKSRGQLKRLKAKLKAKSAAEEPAPSQEPAQEPAVSPLSPPNDRGPYSPERPSCIQTLEPKIEVEDDADYVVEELPVMEGFEDIVARFKLPTAEDDEAEAKDEIDGKGEIIYSDDEMPSEDDEDHDAVPEVSKRKQRKLNRLSVAELKRLVKKPEVVDWVDVSAADPKLLVQIKSHRNSIPIPPHWSQKRDYLQGKRGIEKPAFQLPTFIADTGIATQRDAVKEKEEGSSLKSKTRERVQPKMGKIDIDYQKLHDAFFKFQTKPKMTEFGELYYEGKEFETKLKEKKPGDLSEELKEALSIPPLAPPPWLISMQRFGPPPSYPNLRIPGLSAPIPEGANWGFHPGGWGKPPLDEYNRPLYGDIYGVNQNFDAGQAGEPIDDTVWGELEPDEEGSSSFSVTLPSLFLSTNDYPSPESEEEEDSDDESEADGAPAPADGLQTPSGLDTPSGFTSVASTVPGGIETPDFLELRKRREGTDVTADEGPKSLYTVLPEKETRMRGLMGSDRVYDVSGLAPAAPVLGQEERGTKRKATGVAVALDASELEGLSEADLRAKFEQAGRTAGTHEDFSDFVGKEVAKRRKTADAKKKDSASGSKEKFKF